MILFITVDGRFVVTAVCRVVVTAIADITTGISATLHSTPVTMAVVVAAVITVRVIRSCAFLRASAYIDAEEE
jgi:hypothetical protein